MNKTFRVLMKWQKTCSVIVFYGETRVISIKPNMMRSVDSKILVWILV